MAAADPGLMVCDATALNKPDAATIDALAYAALTARRLGRAIVFVNCAPALVELIEVCGLSDVLPCRGHGRLHRRVMHRRLRKDRAARWAARGRRRAPATD